MVSSLSATSWASMNYHCDKQSNKTPWLPIQLCEGQSEVLCKLILYEALHCLRISVASSHISTITFNWACRIHIPMLSLLENTGAVQSWQSTISRPMSSNQPQFLDISHRLRYNISMSLTSKCSWSSCLHFQVATKCFFTMYISVLLQFDCKELVVTNR